MNILDESWFDVLVYFHSNSLSLESLFSVCPDKSPFFRCWFTLWLTVIEAGSGVLHELPQVWHKSVFPFPGQPLFFQGAGRLQLSSGVSKACFPLRRQQGECCSTCCCPHAFWHFHFQLSQTIDELRSWQKKKYLATWPNSVFSGFLSSQDILQFSISEWPVVGEGF